MKYRFPEIFLIAKLLCMVFFSADVHAYLSLIAVLDEQDSTSSVFEYREGYVWWVLNSDYVIVDRRLGETQLAEDEYFLLLEQAPDHSERIYPMDGNRVRRYFDRDAHDRLGGIYIYNVKKCTASTCAFVARSMMVYDDRNDSPVLGTEFEWAPVLIEQVLQITEDKVVSSELQSKLSDLEEMQSRDPTRYGEMYAIARSIAITREYQELIFGE